MDEGGAEPTAPTASNSTVPVEFEAARKFIITQAFSALAAAPILALVAYLFGLIWLRCTDDFLDVPMVISPPIEQLWTIGGLTLAFVVAIIGIFDKQARRFIRWRREHTFKEGPRVAVPTDTSFVKAAWGSLEEMLFVLFGIILLGTGACIGFAAYKSQQTLAQLAENCARCETIRTSHGPIRGVLVRGNSGHLLVMTGVGRFALISLDDIQGFSAAATNGQKATAPRPTKASPRP